MQESGWLLLLMHGPGPLEHNCSWIEPKKFHCAEGRWLQVLSVELTILLIALVMWSDNAWLFYDTSFRKCLDLQLVVTGPLQHWPAAITSSCTISCSDRTLVKPNYIEDWKLMEPITMNKQCRVTKYDKRYPLKIHLGITLKNINHKEPNNYYVIS